LSIKLKFAIATSRTTMTSSKAQTELPTFQRCKNTSCGPDPTLTWPWPGRHNKRSHECQAFTLTWSIAAWLPLFVVAYTSQSTFPRRRTVTATDSGLKSTTTHAACWPFWPRWPVSIHCWTNGHCGTHTHRQTIFTDTVYLTLLLNFVF